MNQLPFASQIHQAVARCFLQPWATLRCLGAGALLLLVLLAPVGQIGDTEFGRWALLPPLLALALVLVSGNIVFSMLVAVLAGAVIHSGSALGVITGLKRYFLDNLLDPAHLYVIGFGAFVLGTVEVTRNSGGTQAIVDWVRRALDTRRKAKLGVAFAGLLIFFDDYANSMIIGPTFQPLTDRFRISREKLAYIVDSTAAPIAGVALVSTWVAYEVGVLGDALRQTGVATAAYSLLVQALPLRFYCLLSVAFVFMVCVSQLDFGPMRIAEEAAVRAEASPGPESSEEDGGGRRRDFALPIFVLLAAVAIGLVADGGGVVRALQSPADVLQLAYWQDTLSGADNSVRVLFVSAVLSAATALLVPRLGKTRTVQRPFSGDLRALVRGMRGGVFALLVLTCAWGIGAVCKDLRTGATLALLVQGNIPLAATPLITFLVAALTALMTGTSWGTMAILVPAAVPLGYATGDDTLLVLTVAAVMDGAIFGDHCSPISDTTILSAVSSGCGELEHVRTQLPYAVFVMCVAAIAGYVAVAVGVPLFVAYALGCGSLWGGLRLLGRAPTPRSE